MWNFIKQKLAKLGCFLMIALIMIGVTAATRLVFGWLGHDEASKEMLSVQAGDFVGKGLLAVMFLLGIIWLGRQLLAVRQGRRTHPPPLPGAPPPLPSSSPPPLPEIRTKPGYVRTESRSYRKSPRDP